MLHSRAQVGDYVDRAELNRLFASHCSGERRHSFSAWAVWVLERWLEDQRRARDGIGVMARAGESTSFTATTDRGSRDARAHCARARRTSRLAQAPSAVSARSSTTPRTGAADSSRRTQRVVRRWRSARISGTSTSFYRLVSIISTARGSTVRPQPGMAACRRTGAAKTLTLAVQDAARDEPASTRSETVRIRRATPPDGAIDGRTARARRASHLRMESARNRCRRRRVGETSGMAGVNRRHAASDTASSECEVAIDVRVRRSFATCRTSGKCPSEVEGFGHTLMVLDMALWFNTTDAPHGRTGVTLGAYRRTRGRSWVPGRAWSTSGVSREIACVWRWTLIERFLTSGARSSRRARLVPARPGPRDSDVADGSCVCAWTDASDAVGGGHAAPQSLVKRLCAGAQGRLASAQPTASLRQKCGRSIGVYRFEPTTSWVLEDASVWRPGLRRRAGGYLGRPCALPSRFLIYGNVGFYSVLGGKTARGAYRRRAASSDCGGLAVESSAERHQPGRGPGRRGDCRAEGADRVPEHSERRAQRADRRVSRRERDFAGREATRQIEVKGFPSPSSWPDAIS